MAVNTYYIPDGPKNLAVLFPGIDFTQIAEYNIQLLDNSSNVLATSPQYQKKDLCEDDVHIHFVTYPGGVDTAIFKVIDVSHEVKADNYQLPATIPLVRSTHSLNRFNIKVNEIYVAQEEFEEQDLVWLTELFDTPFAWLEWKGIEGQADDYIPIVLLDQKIQLKKDIERYSYTVTLAFALSHEKITLRG